MKKLFLIFILLLSFGNISYAEEPYNDECGIEQNNNGGGDLQAYKINQEKNVLTTTKLKIKGFKLPKIKNFNHGFKFGKHKKDKNKKENKENNKQEEKLDKYLMQVKIKLKAKDNKTGVGLENIYYSLNNGEYIKYTKQIKLKKSGKYTLKYYSQDLFGNKEKIKEYKFEIINPRDKIKKELKKKRRTKTRF